MLSCFLQPKRTRWMVHCTTSTIESTQTQTGPSTMLIKPLFLLSYASLMLGRSGDEWKNTEARSISAGGPPFMSLDNGMNFYFQSDGNFVIYSKGTVATADAVWYSNTVWAPNI